MGKLNPFTLRPAADITETQTFADPSQPGKEITLTFTAVAGADMSSLMGTRIEEHTQKYILGNKEKDEPPAPVLIPGAREIKVSPRLIRLISMFQEMETPPAGEKPYTFEEWAALGVVMPRAFLDITNWATDLQRRLGEASGNESAATKG